METSGVIAVAVLCFAGGSLIGWCLGFYMAADIARREK